jgi:hypothetical protein
MFLKNNGYHLQDYMAPQPRRPQLTHVSDNLWNMQVLEVSCPFNSYLFHSESH